MGVIDKLVGDLGDKKQWREYKARIKALPAAYRTAAEGVEKYLMYTGNVSDGKKLVAMCHDLADLFERAATDGTPVRDIVGENPSEFVDAFAANYSDGGWVAKQQQKLGKAIDEAEKEES
jgi:DNA-binding ferritin-like protein (Dps family)